MTATAERGMAPHTAPASQGTRARAESAAPAAPRRIKLPRDQDPRNPNSRLAALLDDGSVELITADDDSGMFAAIGTINGCRVVAFCSDPTVMGGAMGMEGCDVVVRAYERAMNDRVPILGIWHSGGARLAEGVLSLHARRPDLPRDDPGVGQHPADLASCWASRPAARRTGRP